MVRRVVGIVMLSAVMATVGAVALVSCWTPLPGNCAGDTKRGTVWVLLLR